MLKNSFSQRNNSQERYLKTVNRNDKKLQIENMLRDKQTSET